LFFVVGMKVSCQKKNEWEGIQKRKIDEGKEGRKENNGRKAGEEAMNTWSDNKIRELATVLAMAALDKSLSMV
jgi:hypothetical protein